MLFDLAVLLPSGEDVRTDAGDIGLADTLPSIVTGDGFFGILLQSLGSNIEFFLVVVVVVSIAFASSPLMARC